MYILHPSDRASLERLRQFFPAGLARIYHSQWGWDFVLYIVPGDTQASVPPPATGEVP